jgi:hypothetical protein
MLAAALPAQALTPADLQRCRALSEDRARLACYDALAAAQAAPPTAPAASTAGPGASAAAMPPPAAAPAPAEAPAAEGAFGRPVVTSGPPQIESRIEGRFEGWDRNTRFRLANGQVWQVTDGSSATLRLTDPVVRVRRAALGSFLMEFEGSNRTVRVRRVD